MKECFSVLGLWMMLMSTSAAYAQSLEGLGMDSAPAPQHTFGLKMQEETKPAEAKKPEKENLQTTEGVQKALATEQEMYKKERENIFLPGGGAEKLFLPTSDGSKRGKVTVLENDDKGNSRPNSNIFLYFDKFGIDRSIGGMVTCSMRFVLISNLDSKLVAFDAKLVWPKITTAISFANVAPNTPMAYNYTLMGEGCYTMDKMPNIIVNRCRVRGMNSAECAEKITWLTDAK